MGEMDDIDEIQLGAHRDNDPNPSAKKIRSGRKRLFGFNSPDKSTLWKRQLASHKANRANHGPVKITLAGKSGGSS